MKAKRRHELQHNVLDAELAKTIEFFKKHGWKIVWVALAAAAVWTGVSMYRSSRATTGASIESRYADLHVEVGRPTRKPEALLGELDELIEQTSVPRVSAMACVDAGDVCAAQARQAAQAVAAARTTGAGKQAVAAHRKAFEKHRGRARGYYAKARDDLPDQHLAVAKAHVGLAALAETGASLLEGDERKAAFAAALAEYRAVAKIGAVAGHPVAALAERAIRRLYDAQEELRDDYTVPVRMATTLPAAPATQPTSKPTTKPATRPTTKPETRPTTKPATRPTTKPTTRPATMPAKKAEKPTSGRSGTTE